MSEGKRLAALILLAAAAWSQAFAAPANASGEAGERILETVEFKGLDGAVHHLAEWKGKVIVLNFWASWCGPCQAEIRDFVQLQNAYGTKGLQIVGVGLDEEPKLKNVERTLGMNYPVLMVPQVSNRRLLAAWGNENGLVPYTVVIDRTGKPTYIHRGPMDEGVFRDQVFPLLGEEGAGT